MSAINYRKYPCRHYSRGYCYLGDSCGFYHDPNLKYHHVYQKSRYTYDGSRIENPNFVLPPEIHQVSMDNEDPGDEIVIQPQFPLLPNGSLLQYSMPPISSLEVPQINSNTTYCFNCAEELAPTNKNYCDTCNAIRQALDTICVTCANTKRYYDYSRRELQECPDCLDSVAPSYTGPSYCNEPTVRSITELYSPIHVNNTLTELRFSHDA